jgi:hypothetical protein
MSVLEVSSSRWKLKIENERVNKRQVIKVNTDLGKVPFERFWSNFEINKHSNYIKLILNKKKLKINEDLFFDQGSMGPSSTQVGWSKLGESLVIIKIHPQLIAHFLIELQLLLLEWRKLILSSVMVHYEVEKAWYRWR